MIACLGCSLRAPVPTAGGGAAGTPDPSVNTVRWTTEAGLDYRGYRVYRAVTIGGRFEELTTGLIPVATNCAEVCSYEFVDRTIDPDSAYFYHVTVVLADGSEQLFTGFARVAPKRKPSANAVP